MKITIIGAGSWGIALSLLLHKNGHKISLWSPFPEESAMLDSKREYPAKLPGIIIPPDIVCTSDLDKAATDAEMFVLVTPSQNIRESARKISGFVKKDAIIVCCSKGMEEDTGKRLSEVIAEELPQAKIAILSGPSHAEEVARNIPTAVVVSSTDINVADAVQNIFMSPAFRVYTNPDIIGVEIGGAIKNIIALSAGISDGLGFGDNTKAALMTRGLAEIARLGVALGGKKDTFFGLSGMGDLIVTCTSMHSRNRRAGQLIGKGNSLEETLKEVGMVVEGVFAVKAAYRLSEKLDVLMPITASAYGVLFENKDPREAFVELMARDKKSESE